LRFFEFRKGKRVLHRNKRLHVIVKRKEYRERKKKEKRKEKKRKEEEEREKCIHHLGIEPVSSIRKIGILTIRLMTMKFLQNLDFYLIY
jgi:hypothetical protein